MKTPSKRRHSSTAEDQLLARPPIQRQEPYDDNPFEQFFEHAPDAVVIASIEGAIRMVNRQAETLFGYPRAALVDAEIELLIPQRYRVRHSQLRADYTAHPRVRPMGVGLELYGVRQDGKEFPVEISLSPIMLHGEHCVMAVIRDVTERKRLERQAREALNTMLQLAEERRKLLQVVLDELPGGVYLTRGRDARLALANRAAEEVWGARWPIGMPMREFLATSGVRIFNNEGRELTEDELATVRAARTGVAIHHHQESIQRPDGRAQPVMLNVVALDSSLLTWTTQRQGKHEPPGIEAPGEEMSLQQPEYASLVILQDISAIKDAERMKDDFITIAAHELKTPMAVVAGYTDLLARQLRNEHAANGNAPPAWEEEALTTIEDATRRLVELVDDLLDVTRLQGGRLHLRIEPHDLVALARRVIRRLSVTTTRHTISLQSDAEHVVVNCDSGRIEQALSNLISNAIKYSPAGGEITVEVTGAVETQLQSGGMDKMAEVRVRDHGIGIPDDQQHRIFGRFSRAENAAALGIGGVGLGLYLCRELIQRQGGRIWFHSVEGQGTIFAFTLPLTEETSDAEAASAV